MPICITCCTPVKTLYTTYSKADDRSLGKGVRLTQCPRCKRFADKYVEHDFVVLFIDLVLIKPQAWAGSYPSWVHWSILMGGIIQVYRHLLFNRLGRADDTLDPSILRLGTLLILFDVYLTWTRVEKASTTNADGAASTQLASAPIVLQYIFFLTLNALATLAQHATIRGLVRIFLPPSASSRISSPIIAAQSRYPEKEDQSQGPSEDNDTASPERERIIGPGHASAAAISTALLVSSCMKLFPILLVIWPDQLSDTREDGGAGLSFASRAHSYIGWAVLLNNIEALSILLDCGYVAAASLALAGSAARWLVEGIMLGTVGLDGDAGPMGDILGLPAKVHELLNTGQTVHLNTIT